LRSQSIGLFALALMTIVVVGRISSKLVVRGHPGKARRQRIDGRRLLLCGHRPLIDQTSNSANRFERQVIYGF